MATFYCIHGSPFHGDGTTSAEATVDGGVGAFNEAIACFNGSVLDPTVAVSQVDTITVTTVTDSIAYTVTINGNLYTYTSIVGETVAGIIQGLVAVIAEAGVTAANITDTSITLTADVAGVPFTTSVTAELALTLTTANVSTNLAVSDGDTIIFQTQRLGANIVTASLTANLTFKGGISSAVRRYVLDDGEVWAGEAGEILIDVGVSDVTFADYSIIVSRNYNIVFQNSSTADFFIYHNANSYFDGIHMHHSSTSITASSAVYAQADDDNCQGRVKVTINTFSNASSESNIMQVRGNYASYDLVHIIFTGAASKSGGSSQAYNKALFDAYNLDSCIEVGTVIFEDVANSFDLIERQGNSSSLVIDRFHHDNPDYDYGISNRNAKVSVSNIKINGIGQFDFYESMFNVISRYETGKFYPENQAILPDKITPWTIKHELLTGINEGRSRKLADLVNYYNQPSGIKTLTINMLLQTDFTTIKNSNFWCTFTYEDTNGVIRSETSLSETLLSASNAVWDVLNYGAVALSPYELSITTQYPIKSDSIISARTYINYDITTADNIAFTNPEVVVS